jgi:hypothetical protein
MEENSEARGSNQLLPTSILFPFLLFVCFFLQTKTNPLEERESLSEETEIKKSPHTLISFLLFISVWRNMKTLIYFPCLYLHLKISVRGTIYCKIQQNVRDGDTHYTGHKNTQTGSTFTLSVFYPRLAQR